MPLKVSLPVVVSNNLVERVLKAFQMFLCKIVANFEERHISTEFINTYF